MATDSKTTEDYGHWTQQSSFRSENDADGRCAATTTSDEEIDVNDILLLCVQNNVLCRGELHCDLTGNYPSFYLWQYY